MAEIQWILLPVSHNRNVHIYVLGSRQQKARSRRSLRAVAYGSLGRCYLGVEKILPQRIPVRNGSGITPFLSKL